MLVFLVPTITVLGLFGGIPIKLPDINIDFGMVIIVALTILTIAVGIACSISVYNSIKQRERAQNFAALRAHAVDSMTGTEFEVFLKHLLTARNFKVKNIWHSNDGGVDLVAKLGDKIYSIQAKRYNNHKADRRAITDAVAGITYRNCTHAMAITNSYFTNPLSNTHKKPAVSL